MVGETVCADGFVGVVRREDVRGWEVDRVVCGEGFRVGDVVRSVVVSGFSSGYSRSLRACNVVENDVPLLLFLREGGSVFCVVFALLMKGRQLNLCISRPSLLYVQLMLHTF